MACVENLVSKEIVAVIHSLASKVDCNELLVESLKNEEEHCEDTLESEAIDKERTVNTVVCYSFERRCCSDWS